MKTFAALLLASGVVLAACDGGTAATPSPEPTPAAAATPQPTEAPAPTDAGGASVTGSIVLPEGASLPADATILVEVLDQSSSDADVVIAEQTIPAAEAGTSPIPFSVEYDPGTIVADDPYVVGAQVNDASGNLIFTAFEPVAVITSGNPTEDVTLTLVAVGA